MGRSAFATDKSLLLIPPIFLELGAIVINELAQAVGNSTRKTRFLPAKNGCKTKVAFILKYLTAKCMYQPKVSANVAASQNQLTAKCRCKLKVAASQKELLAKHCCHRNVVVAVCGKWLLANKKLFQPTAVTGIKGGKLEDVFYNIY